jgi:SAM-dependent methyltransferase
MTRSTTNKLFNFSIGDLPPTAVIQDTIGWDISNWKRAVDFWNRSTAKSPKKILVIGEREGGISLLMALNGADCICSDARPFKSIPLPLHEKYKVTDHMEYQMVDVQDLPFEDGAVDMIVFKSVLGALMKKELIETSFKEMHRVLKPGGELLFAENLQASAFHRWARKKFTKWGSNWYYPSLSEIATMLDEFKETDMKTLGVLAAFGRSEKQRKVLGKLDRWIEKLVPRSWRYIVSVVAIK